MSEVHESLEGDHIAAAMFKALQAHDEVSRGEGVNLEKVARWSDSAKAVFGAVVGFSILMGTGFMSYRDLKDKPTDAEVNTAIETRPEHEVTSATLSAQGTQIAEVELKVDRVVEVLQYQIERDAWREKVVDHKLARKKGDPPPKPDPLQAKETRLLGLKK